MNAFKVISTAMLCIIGMVLLLFASVADGGIDSGGPVDQGVATSVPETAAPLH